MIRKESVTNDILDVLKHEDNKSATRFILAQKLAPYYPISVIKEGIDKLKEMRFVEDTDSDTLKIVDNHREIARKRLRDYFENV